MSTRSNALLDIMVPYNSCLDTDLKTRLIYPQPHISRPMVLHLSSSCSVLFVSRCVFIIAAIGIPCMSSKAFNA